MPTTKIAALMLLGVLLSHNSLTLTNNSYVHRSTAKKFLAAANFLEVLKTFPKSDISAESEVRFSLLCKYSFKISYYL